MALHEGCRRLRKVGRIFILFGMGLALLGTIVVGVAAGFQAVNAAPLITVLLPPILFAEIIGGALWIVGWVVEGFALPASAKPDNMHRD